MFQDKEVIKNVFSLCLARVCVCACVCEREGRDFRIANRFKCSEGRREVKAPLFGPPEVNVAQTT